jgi:hypothetical protein
VCKNLKIILDIVSDLTYKHENFQREIPCIMGYTINENLIKFEDLNIYIVSSTCLSFLCSQKYEVFKIDFFLLF